MRHKFVVEERGKMCLRVMTLVRTKQRAADPAPPGWIPGGTPQARGLILFPHSPGKYTTDDGLANVGPIHQALRPGGGANRRSGGGGHERAVGGGGGGRIATASAAARAATNTTASRGDDSC